MPNFKFEVCRLWIQRGCLWGFLVGIFTPATARALRGWSPKYLHPPTHPPTAGEGTFDSGSLCAKTEQGFVFLLNSCNQTGTAFAVDLKVNVEKGGCSDNFWVIFLSVAAGIVGLMLLLYILPCLCGRCMRCKKKRQVAPPVVEGSTVELGPSSGPRWTAAPSGSAAERRPPPVSLPQPAARAAATRVRPPAGSASASSIQSLSARPPLASDQPAPTATMTYGLLADAPNGDSAAPIHSSSVHPVPSGGAAAGRPATASRSKPYPKA